MIQRLMLLITLLTLPLFATSKGVLYDVNQIYNDPFYDAIVSPLYQTGLDGLDDEQRYRVIHDFEHLMHRYHGKAWTSDINASNLDLLSSHVYHFYKIANHYFDSVKKDPEIQNVLIHELLKSVSVLLVETEGIINFMMAKWVYMHLAAHLDCSADNGQSMVASLFPFDKELFFQTLEDERNSAFHDMFGVLVNLEQTRHLSHNASIMYAAYKERLTQDYAILIASLKMNPTEATNTYETYSDVQTKKRLNRWVFAKRAWYIFLDRWLESFGFEHRFQAEISTYTATIMSSLLFPIGSVSK